MKYFVCVCVCVGKKAFAGELYKGNLTFLILWKGKSRNWLELFFCAFRNLNGNIHPMFFGLPIEYVYWIIHLEWIYYVFCLEKFLVTNLIIIEIFIYKKKKSWRFSFLSVWLFFLFFFLQLFDLDDLWMKTKEVGIFIAIVFSSSFYGSSNLLKDPIRPKMYV